MGKYTEQINARLKAISSDYFRPLLQTFFTSAEWNNVWMSEEFAKHLKEGKSFHKFSFFKKILGFWKIFFKSYNAARKHSSRWELFTSYYMAMNLFIGLFSTIEYIIKGLFSLILWPFLPKKNNTAFQAHVAQLFDNYAKFIHEVPFYNYPYFSKIKPLIQSFWNSNNKTVVDFFTFIFTFCELIAKAILSFPIAGYKEEESKEEKKISVLIKISTIEQLSQPEYIKKISNQIKAINYFLKNGSNASVEIENQNGKEQIYTRYSAEKGKLYAYAQVKVFRYKDFPTGVEALLKQGFKIVKISGQDIIQIECSAKAMNAEALKSAANSMITSVNGENTQESSIPNYPENPIKNKKKPKCKYLYKHLDGDSFFTEVHTKILPEFIKSLNDAKYVDLKQIYDF